MEILDQTEACFAVDEDLLNFTIEEEDFSEGIGASSSSSSLEPSNPTETTPPSSCVTQNGSFREFFEEDLEWLSNKDAFPTVETCFGVLSDTPNLARNQQSPASVLDNNGSTENSGIIASCCGLFKIPVRARGKRRRRVSGFGIFLSQQFQETVKNKQEPLFSSPQLWKMKHSGADIGRRCLHCQSDTTPQWRAGPMGPKTLCNACGVRYKSGRLVPEYRPANSPTFSSVLHSNSHRKVVEMRRKKQLVGGEEMMPNEISGYYNIGI